MEQGSILMLIAAAGVVLFGQWIKSHANWDSRLAVVGMTAAGLLIYGVRFGWPTTFEWDSVDFWLKKAVPWSLVLPGIASAVGHFIPWFKTDSKQ